MELSKFLSSSQLQKSTDSVITLQAEGGKLAPLFRYYFRRSLSQKEKVVVVDVATKEMGQLQAELSMAFLGEAKTYWLSGIEELHKAHLKQLVSFCKGYSGPHRLYIPASISVGSIITIPPMVDRGTFEHLYHFIVGRPVHTQFIQYLFKMHRQIPLESACILIEYAQLIRSNADEFFTEWLPNIIHPERSLFILSGYLFSGNIEGFFAVWNTMKDEYSVPFWTTFWSEQLFKASGYHHYASQRVFATAKKISFRLPFSYMQKDWKRFSLAELIAAHDHIRTIDWRTKNGMDAYLSLFYTKFLLGDFKRQCNH